MARWLGRLLAPVVVTIVALTALAAPASAHGRLAMSTPAKDGTVSEPMESLALYFTEKPAAYAYFTVTTPGGARVDRPWSHGAPKRLDEPVREYTLVEGVWQPNLYHMGFPANVPVAYWPEQGLYVVRYMSVASDGEQVRGELRFTYKGKMSGPPKGWKAPTNEPDPALLVTAEPGAPSPGTSGTSGMSDVATSPATPQAGAQVTPQAGSGGAPRAASGIDLSVWLLPALLVVGAGFMVVRAARRPAPRGAETRRLPTGPPARRPPARSTTASRRAERGEAGRDKEERDKAERGKAGRGKTARPARRR